MGLEGEASFRGEEAHQVRCKRVRELLGTAEFVNAGERVGLARVERLQLDAATRRLRDVAAGQHADAEVHRHRAGVKEVKRPNVEGAAGEIYATGRRRRYRSRRGCTFLHENLCITASPHGHTSAAAASASSTMS